MKTAGMTVLTGIIGLVFSVGCAPVFGDSDAETAKPLALRAIMQDLGRNMQAITAGISREDWQQVETVALLVADHPRPPLFEKARILKYAGGEAVTFRTYDSKTHAAALALGKAAAAADGDAVIAAFATLQTACLTCHRNFRPGFIEYFYAPN